MGHAEDACTQGEGRWSSISGAGDNTTLHDSIRTDECLNHQASTHGGATYKNTPPLMCGDGLPLLLCRTRHRITMDLHLLSKLQPRTAQQLLLTTFHRVLQCSRQHQAWRLRLTSARCQASCCLCPAQAHLWRSAAYGLGS
jgi:hypothetical protein